MHDIRFIREHGGKFRNSLERRGIEYPITEVRLLDQKFRGLKEELDEKLRLRKELQEASHKLGKELDAAQKRLQSSTQKGVSLKAKTDLSEEDVQLYREETDANTALVNSLQSNFDKFAKRAQITKL